MQSYDGITLRQLRLEIKERVVTKGAVSKYFDSWTRDIYSQYQRITANEVRIGLKLRFAIYSGGTIDNTRAWCEKHNGKVLHESEIESWRHKNWQGKRKSGPYNPFHDCGDINCRHRWLWISDQLAFRRRPELKNIYGDDRN